MNAMTQTELHTLSNSHLDALEEETIFILREVAAAFERPALLFSGGKDSLVMLKCAEKAFGAGRIPYPLLMIDTGHNFTEVTDFRDLRAKELGAELIVRNVEDSMARGTVRRYLSHTYQRLGVRDRAQAISWCFAHGVVSQADMQLIFQGDADAAAARPARRRRGHDLDPAFPGDRVGAPECDGVQHQPAEYCWFGGSSWFIGR